MVQVDTQVSYQVAQEAKGGVWKERETARGGRTTRRVYIIAASLGQQTNAVGGEYSSKARGKARRVAGASDGAGSRGEMAGDRIGAGTVVPGLQLAPVSSSTSFPGGGGRQSIEPSPDSVSSYVQPRTLPSPPSLSHPTRYLTSHRLA